MDSKRKIKVITILSVFVAILSLGIGYSSMVTNEKESGVSTRIENIYDIKLDNINEAIASKEEIEYSVKPVIVGNEIDFSLKNFIYDNSISFKFDIINNGNVDVEIKNIELEGIEAYANNLEYSMSNIQVGDIIKGNANIKDNTFVLKYKDPIYDKYNNLINIDLDKLVLKIEF